MSSASTFMRRKYPENKPSLIYGILKEFDSHTWEINGLIPASNIRRKKHFFWKYKSQDSKHSAQFLKKMWVYFLT